MTSPDNDTPKPSTPPEREDSAPDANGSDPGQTAAEGSAVGGPKKNGPAETVFGGSDTSTAGTGGIPTSKADANWWVGKRIGKYDVIGLLGIGGMGAVYRAHDTTIQRDVAVKILPRHLTGDDATRRRFLSEARSAGRLNHPNAVVIHEIAEEQEYCFIAMELVEGGSVGEWLQRKERLSVEEATQVMNDACEGLIAAHDIGVIHRDIKPENLLRTKSGLVKVCDFGLAKLAGDKGSQITQTGQILGTPYFMSPEQCESGDIDHRCDIYSLGATYYSLLTGRNPYQDAGSAIKVMFAHCNAEPPNPELVRPDLPPACSHIIRKAMSKRPEDRYQSVEEMLAALRAVSGTNSEASRSGLSASAATSSAATSSAATSSTTFGVASPPTRRLALLSGLAGALIAVAVGALLFLTRGGDVESVAEPSPEPNATVAPATPSGPPIKVGVLHSLTGTMSASESPVVDATLLAIQEINDSGGLLGRPVEPVVRDGRSNPEVFAEQSELLINEEKVSTVFGCWTSASRKTVVPVFEKHDHLLIYPLHYEGAEQSPNVVYTGATPNQLIIPTLKWAYAFENKRRFFLVGSDYVYPRTTNEIVKDYLKELGAEVVGEAYAPLGSTRFGAIVKKIIAAKPDVILNTINGDSNVTFFRELQAAGVTPKDIPTISTSIGEEEIRGLQTDKMAGDLAPWSYFQSIKTAENTAFVTKVRKRFGPQRVVTSPMETAYYGVMLWAHAVEKCGSDHVDAIRDAMRGQSYLAPHGEVRVDPATQHTYMTPRIGKIRADGQFEIVWSGASPVRPVPYPETRTKEEWDTFLQELYAGYGNQWQAPSED